MAFERMIKAADDLVGKLNLRGPGKPGIIAEADARRYLVKSLRELRHAIAAGTANPVDFAVRAMEHLGVELKNTEANSAVTTVFETEAKAFVAEKKAAKDDHVFHEDHGFMAMPADGMPSSARIK